MALIGFVYGWHLQMRQCDCNGAAGRTFCVALIVVCIGRHAISAMWSLVLTSRVLFVCVHGLLQVALLFESLDLMSIDC